MSIVGFNLHGREFCRRLRPATWVAPKGVTIVEGQESLYRMRMQAAYEAGDRNSIAG